MLAQMLVVTIACALVVLLIAVDLVNGGKDYYKILGLKRTAKEKDIKKGNQPVHPVAYLVVAYCRSACTEIAYTMKNVFSQCLHIILS